jgi:gamma-glutamyltranspeptidase/glutathione hydrolase
MVMEGRIKEAVRKELEARGHKVKVAGDWVNGKVMAVRLDAKNGVIAGGVSPRGQIGYVMGS